MIAIHINKVLVVQSGFTKEIADHYDSAKQALSDLIVATTDATDQAYVQAMYQFWCNNADIVTTLPNNLEKLKLSAPAAPKDKRTRMKKGKPEDYYVDRPIKNKIVEALGYKKLRDNFYAHYFHLLGLKNCVYCNAQMALAIKTSRNGFSAKFDVDHYNPKSKFPWMCISLFNLYPSCVPCNRAKGSKPVFFKLYSDEASKLKKSDFSFRLTAEAKSRYLTTRDYRSLEFTFDEPVRPTGYQSHNKVFHISEVYATQLDVAEQLLLSSQMYDTANKKALYTSFSKLGLSPELFQRVILGTYPNARDIHKRAMSKFIQDIAKDLGL